MREVSQRTGLIGFGICFLLVLTGFLINVAEGSRRRGPTWWRHEPHDRRSDRTSLIVGIFGLVAAASAALIFLVVKPRRK